MKRFLILLFLSYASSDKLDLTYLPPPGSQYSGGRPEDIQTPLEYPKASYSTTFRPQAVPNGQKVPNLDDYKATIGINRGIPSQISEDFVPQKSKGLLNNFQNTFNLPTTTTASYAFTQTTTHPPSKNFETTVSSINPITGLPFTTSFIIPSRETDQAYRGYNNQLRPNAPDYQQSVNLDNQRPTSGVVSQLPGSMLPYRNKKIEIEQNKSVAYQTPQGFQQSNSINKLFGSQVPFKQLQYPENQTVTGGSIRQPGIISSTTASPGFIPVITDGPNTNNIQDFTTLNPEVSQSGNFKQSLDTYFPDTKFQFGQNRYSLLENKLSQQQYPKNFVSNINDLPNNGQQFLNTPTTIPTQGFSNQKIPTSELLSSEINKPERLLADADRNAVILNYKNIIMPDGFEFSFDTSNGTHMDENGTAIDGVKAEGSYSYIGDDGKVYTVIYTADENGFQPHGDHLPTPPPIPEAIQKNIEKANQEKEAGIIHDGSYDEEKYGYKSYEGPIKHYPTHSDRIKYDSIIGPNIQKEKQKYPSQNGSATSVTSQKVSNKAPTGKLKSVVDFNDHGSPQEEYREDQSVGDEIIRTNNKNTLTPENSSLEVSNIASMKKFNQELRKQYVNSEIFRDPDYKIDNKQNKQLYKDKNFQNVNRQRPLQNHQYPIKENEDGTIRYITDKESPRHPLPQEQKTTIGKVDGIGKPNFKYNKDDNNTQEIVRRPVTRMRNDSIDTQHNELEEHRLPGFKYSLQPPTDHSVVDSEKFEAPQPSHENGNNQFDTIHNNNRLPTKYTENKINSKLSYKDFKPSSGISSRFRPSGFDKPSIKMNFEQTISKKRRPLRPGLKIDKNVVDRYDEGSIEDIRSEYETENYDETNYGLDTTPIYEIMQNSYDVSIDLKSPDIQSIITKRPQAVTKPSQLRDRFQKSQTSLQNQRIKENDNVQYGQKLIGKPSQYDESKHFSNNSGYQYMTPRNKFYYEKGNEFSTRYPMTESYSTTKRPSQQLTFDTKDSTAQPFLKTKVSRIGIKNSEDNNEGSKPEAYTLPNQLNKNFSEKYTTPGYIFSNNRISSQPSTINSLSNSRTTQYDQQYSTPSPYKTTSQGIPQTLQQTYNEKDSNTQVPYDTYISLQHSTTPISVSRRPSYYDNSVKDISIPRKNDGHYTEGTNGQKLLDNIGTNPSISRVDSDFGKPSAGGSTIDKSHTIQATTPEYEYSEGITTPESRTTRPTVQTVSKITGNVYGNLPSTTYRPSYTISGLEQTSSRRPISKMDVVRGSSQNFEQQSQQFTPSMDGTLPVNGNRYRFEMNGTDLKKPSSDQDQENQKYQTTTRVIGEDFSGPKQEQRFDPKLGYYY